jgi:hypothetical protein
MLIEIAIWTILKNEVLPLSGTIALERAADLQRFLCSVKGQYCGRTILLLY